MLTGRIGNGCAHAQRILLEAFASQPKEQYLASDLMELTFLASGTFEIVRWILGWGEAAEVLRPTTADDPETRNRSCSQVGFRSLPRNSWANELPRLCVLKSVR